LLFVRQSAHALLIRMKHSQQSSYIIRISPLFRIWWVPTTASKLLRGVIIVFEDVQLVCYISLLLLRSLLCAPPCRRGATYCDCSHTCLKPHVQTSRNFSHVLPVAVAHSSNDKAICYIQGGPKEWTHLFSLLYC